MASKKKKPRFDTLAKTALAGWPQSSTSLWPASRDGGVWLRAQPPDGVATGPRLKAAGTDSFKTQPDGLWIFLAPKDGFADCIAIEACSSNQNFADKRSRYQPSTTATVLECPLDWLTTRVGTASRWERAGTITEKPTASLVLPTRFLRVLYFLEDNLYAQWRACGVPAGHEFVAAYSSINSYTSQKMQSFLSRMSIVQHFYTNG